jgi:hypothetical protein
MKLSGMFDGQVLLTFPFECLRKNETVYQLRFEFNDMNELIVNLFTAKGTKRNVANTTFLFLLDFQ